MQDLLNAGALNVNPSAIITVNSTNDAVDDLNSGVTTLRDAINQANGDTGKDLIVFDRSLFSNAQTIGLNSGKLDLTHSLSIIAPRDSLTGEDLVTVSGNNASRVFEIESGATVNLDGLIVADGSVIGYNGGGIKNSGTLTLDNSIVSNNNALFSQGGGIYNSGNLEVRNTTISNNNNTYNDFSGGGGIYNNGNSTINNSTISNNTAKNMVFISGRGFVTVAGMGGGIYNQSGSLTLVFSTLTGNQATDGGGVFNATSGFANVRNTIIALNLKTANGLNSDVSGTFSSNGGYNLIGDGTGSTGFRNRGDIVGTSDNPIDPRLASLDFNGGPTQTIALLPDSPAINAGDPRVLNTDPTTDQRGLPRRASDGRTDIGAFEFSS